LFQKLLPKSREAEKKTVYCDFTGTNNSLSIYVDEIAVSKIHGHPFISAENGALPVHLVL